MEVRKSFARNILVRGFVISAHDPELETCTSPEHFIVEAGGYPIRHYLSFRCNRNEVSENNKNYAA